MKFQRAFFVVLLLLISGAFSSAATSSFSYQAYKRMALNELRLEQQYWADLNG
ncbi:hypothetical protein HY994_03110 [Candidatus Micrarchaeota archaeon]|nr:hypothetical protein [Candidatus Micrarchaeota archaeon]